MRLRLLVVLGFVALLTVFVVSNWSVFAAPSVLSLGLFSFEAPLGLAMLGLVVVITLAFAVYMAIWQGKILMQERHQAKQLQTQRTLADTAEASRFVELGKSLHTEFEQLSARLHQAETALTQHMQDNTNSLAAMLGEIDDRKRRT
ncbi:MAG: LapA family protein [Rhodoferax sp.]